MFKSARWRSEKNKVKAVFKLQFHATQVSQLGVDSLTLSIIPVETGKPSTKLEKASIEDGACRWENAVHETVKFFREPKTGKIAEKIYRFSVANGSAKNSILGDVSIDFAAYAEASKASSVSLPLKNSNTDAALHVLIQRLQDNVDNVDQREVEECDDTKPKPDRSLRTHLSNGNLDEMLAIDEPISNTTHNGELNNIQRESSGSDLTFSSSDSSSGVNTPREIGLRNGDVNHEPSISVPQRKTSRASVTEEESGRSQWEWSDNGVGTEKSTHSQPASDLDSDTLKAELVALSRQANMAELELQALRKQIVKESKRGVDLSREVVSVKEERDSYKAECERLKSFQQQAKASSRLSLEGGNLRTLVEEIRQELNYEKDLNSNLRLQLQKTQEANTELILAVQDLEETVEAKNKDIENPPSHSKLSDDDEEQKALEQIVKDHSSSKQTTVLEQRIIDLNGEIEIYRRDRDELEMQIEQLALDYEILKQENHDITYRLEQSQIQEQLKMQYECTSYGELGSQIGSLEKDLKKTSEEFSHSLVTIKKLEEELKVRSKESSDFSVTISELESRSKGLDEELAIRSKESENSLATIENLKSRIGSLEDELKIRSNESSESLTTISDLKSQIRNLNGEIKIKSKESLESLMTIEDLKTRIRNLDGELRVRSKESSESQTTISELKSYIESLDRELKKQSKESSESLLTISELKSQIESLDRELKKQSKEASDYSAKVNVLESHIESLENELDEQSRGFESDLEALMVAKVEQEQRAIRAEESLRKMRWKSASTAEKIQQEFKRLSTQMSSTFEANEKVAAKAIREAGELRAQKLHLEEKLRKVKDEYEAKLLSTDREIVKNDNDETIGFLKSELEKIKDQCSSLKTSLLEDEVEKEKLRKQIFQLKSDLKKKDEGNKTAPKNPKPVSAVPRSTKEVTNLREKIKLLEGQIRSKEAALEISTTSFSEKEKDLQNKIEELESRVEELNHSSSFETVITNGEIKSETNHDEASLTKRDENGTKNPDKTEDLASLKSKNEFMEGELKEMQERYSEISLKFAEVEGERQKLVMTVRYLKNNKKN